MYYRVVVTPGARRELLAEKSPGVFVVAVREKAERGEANARVLALVARHLGVSPKRLRFVSGARGKNKRVEIV